MPGHLIRLLATATQTDNAGTNLLRSTWALFSIITVLLILFVLVIAALAVLRSRRRTQRRRESRQEPHVDAWSEAGRRVHGYSDDSDDRT